MPEPAFYAWRDLGILQAASDELHNAKCSSQLGVAKSASPWGGNGAVAFRGSSKSQQPKAGNAVAIIVGHGRVEVAKLIVMKYVPVRRLSHSSKGEVRAHIFAVNELAENAGWDRDLLAI